MKALPLVVAVVALAAPLSSSAADDTGASLPVPSESRGDPAAGAAEAVDPRETSNLLLMFGSGFPHLVHAEVDVALSRYLAAITRVGGLPPFLWSASVGAMGILPLSSDTALVPHHALAVELSYGFVFAGGEEEGLGTTSQESGPHYHRTATPFLSAGYLFTSLDGLHLRLMAGALRPESDRWYGDLRIALGGLL
ncbi:MAG TPA: hypothetical protein VGD74_05100 [Vulgatibacter sp.]